MKYRFYDGREDWANLTPKMEDNDDMTDSMIVEQVYKNYRPYKYI